MEVHEVMEELRKAAPYNPVRVVVNTGSDVLITNINHISIDKSQPTHGGETRRRKYDGFVVTIYASQGE